LVTSSVAGRGGERAGRRGAIVPTPFGGPAADGKLAGVLRVHLDTDLGSDTDDLCALAMLLGWPGVEIVGVTTVSDPGGIRAGMTRYALGLAGRDDIPVAAGAEGSLGGYFIPLEFPDVWPEPIAPAPSPPGAAIDLLGASVDAGATVVAIGPFTNLAAFEAARPGSLAEVPVVVMGGWITPPLPGYPEWVWDQEVNTNQDAVAAKVVFERCRPVATQIAATLETFLRERDLPALEEAGPLARLIARQARLRGDEHHMRRLPERYPALPHDLLNFQYDPLAAAIACGWDGARIQELRIRPELVGDRLRLPIAEDGVPTRVVMGADGERLARDFVDAVVRAAAAG
jgi:inosine-uridine nucleoside N-ribohydrolase